MRISDWSSDVCSSDLHILHSAERNSVEPEGGRGRDGGVADVHIVHGTSVPARFDLAPFDAGIGERFVERLAHEFGRVGIPTLAETRTAHTQDRDLVLDSRRHDYATVATGVAFQKYRLYPRVRSRPLMR